MWFTNLSSHMTDGVEPRSNPKVCPCPSAACSIAGLSALSVAELNYSKMGRLGVQKEVSRHCFYMEVGCH